MSEQQLVAALAASGRDVRVSDLITWRRNGLLPQLASRGVGIAKGKTYGWHERDIVARAILVCDAIRQYGRNDMALLLLFLSGYSVPLPQLRRAWTFRCRLRRAPTIRAFPAIMPIFGFAGGNALSAAMLAVAGAVQTHHHQAMIPLLERALERLGYERAGIAPLCRALLAMEAALDASDLVSAARDTEIDQAQRYLRPALDFLRGCALEEQGSLAAIFGPSIFALVLALLRSGQGAVIARLAAGLPQAPPRRAAQMLRRQA